jgi:hypothetical protein
MKALALAIAAASLLTGSICLAQAVDGNNPDAVGAAGDSNQAVVPTRANAPTPASGANSFTEAQARSSLEASGYSIMLPLTKDDDGIWRGKGQKNGSITNVWVDYKGNIGEVR